MDENRDQVKRHDGASSVSKGCASHYFFQSMDIPRRIGVYL